MTDETSLSLTTTLLIEELWGGDALIAPVADLSQASCGDEHVALLEQEMFLAEHLGQARPATVASHVLPEGTQLRQVDVLVPREDLTGRLALRTPVRLPCLEIPAGKARWVVVLPLRHTFYLEPDEPFEEVTRAEVLRLVAAEEPRPLDYLRLLPAREQRLERLGLVIERTDRVPTGRAASLRKALIERHKRKRAAEVLESIARPWHGETGEGPVRPIEGREAELGLLGALLGGADERVSVLLLGPEAAGKTELLRGWFARERAAGRERLLYQMSGAQLIAGMSGLGQWQERIKRVFEAAEQLDAILYFDNLGDLFAERVEGSVDLAGAMKPYLEQGRVRLVGELTPEMWELAESRQAGFVACLSRLKVEPLTPAATARALAARVAFDRRHEPDRATIDERAVAPLVDLAERYLPYRAFPGKAFRLYEELRGVHGEELAQSGRGATLTVDRLYEHFSLSSGVPSFLLRDDRTLVLADVERALGQQLVGQREAVRRVAETVCVTKAGLQPTGKPLSTFLFVGPTGVGKTELARALATYLFGSPERVVRFDMSEYMDVEAAERLIRGTDRADGLLTRRVREQPFCVLLLDEIEKASRGVFDLLLQVCGEGRLTDARGRVAYFHNAIIIMTSNLGAAHHRPSAGFGASGGEDEAYYVRQVNAAFRPEFVNRLDRIIAFAPLTAAEAERVARMALERICGRRGLVEAGVQLLVSQRALATLARGGYSARYGARALRRHLEDRLVAPVARLLSGLGGGGREAQVRVLAPGEDETEGDERLTGLDDPGGLRFEVLRRRREARQDDRGGVQGIARLRREANRLLALGRVQQVREQIDYLLAQINYGHARRHDRRHDRDRRDALDIQELQADLHRLSECHGALTTAARHLEDTEELALAALFDGTPLGDLPDEAATAWAQAQRSAVRALVAQEPRRDAVLLRACETHGELVLELWRQGLAASARELGWELCFHVPDDDGPRGLWPRWRRWGPPRSVDEIAPVLARKSKRPTCLLVSARGPYAGALLALEAGPRGWDHIPGQEGHHGLMIEVMAMRTVLSDEDWKHKALEVPKPADIEQMKRLKPVRDVDARLGRVRVAATGEEVDLGARLPAAVHEEASLLLLRHHEREDAPDRDVLFRGPLDQPTEGA